MIRVRPSVLALGMLCTAAPALSAQSSLEDALAQYSATSVQGYVQPMVDLFGANLNSGFFSGRASLGSGISFRVSLIGMAASISDDQKTYTASTPPGFDPATFETATIFGGPGTTVTDAGNPSLEYRGSDGLINASLFPFAAPQLSIGFFGTEATLRFVATPTFGDDDQFPKASLLAFGLRHNVGRYLGPALPVDLGVGVMYSTFKVGDIVNVTGLIIGAQASKTVSALTIYGGAAWEQSKMNLTYTSTDPSASGSVDIDIDAANTFRFTTGLSLNVMVARIFADANFGSVTSFSAGLTFGN